MGRDLSIAFAAGCLGALINSLAVWAAGEYGLNARLGVAIHPELSAAWLYPRLVWGGLWGLLLVLPWLPHRALLRGLVFSLAPTLFALLYFYPYRLHKGMLGLELGQFTPLLVALVNAVWGVVAALWYRAMR